MHGVYFTVDPGGHREILFFLITRAPIGLIGPLRVPDVVKAGFSFRKPLGRTRPLKLKVLYTPCVCNEIGGKAGGNLILEGREPPMQSAGKAQTIPPSADASGLRFAIVVSRFNSLVTKELLSGALEVIERNGGKVADQLVLWAPGSFEIPVIAQAALEKGGLDGVIALGCVMKGETTHNDYIVGGVVSALNTLSLQHKVPVCFGILTPETMDQALNRAGLKMGNKGEEAALAAIETAQTIRQLRKKK